MIKKLALFAALCFASVSAQAADYYISTATGTAGGTGAQNDPYDTLNRATSARGAGNNYILMDGTYSVSANAFNVTNMTTGTLTAWTTFQAEHDGGAIITAGLSMRDNTTPIQTHMSFIGLKWQDSNTKSIQGDYLKFFRCAFNGGPSTGNTVAVQVGGNDNGTNLTRHVLFEDVWVSGLGGRYKMLWFNAENIIGRRIVIRNDAGWNNYQNVGNPEASFALYNSSACEVQDMLIIDNTAEYSPEYTQAFYFIHNPNAVPDHAVQGNNINGLFIYNNKSVAMRADAASTLGGNNFNNLISVNSQDFGASWGSNSNSSATLTNSLFTRHNMPFSPVASSGGVGFWSSGKITAHDIIVSSFTTGADFAGITISSFNSYNNSSITAGGKTYIPTSTG